MKKFNQFFVSLLLSLVLVSFITSPLFATNAKQVDFLRAGIMDTAGSALSLGKVYTYEAGTTTNKTCYTDATKSTSATNPVILDALGQATLYCDGNYDFVIKTADNSSVASLLNFNYSVPGTNNRSTTAVSADYTATATDYLIVVNTASGNVNITLPTSSGNSGLQYNIVKGSADAYTVTATPNGSQTIAGATSKVLSNQYNTLGIISDGSNWQMEITPDVATKKGTETLTNKTLTSAILTTPSITGGTATGGTITSATISNPIITGHASNLIFNLKPTVNAAVNKLDIFTKSGGAVPDASNTINVMIPDGNGYTQRTRAAAYLSGTSQFILADGTAYWGAVSGADNLKLHLYEIYDANGGIVHALSRFAGFLQVPTTTTVGDDDYFLLEASSTYTRAATDHCVCVGSVWANYNTANTPDWTFLNTPADLKPMVEWNPKSNYTGKASLAISNTSGSDITNYSVASVVVKQSGSYLIWGKLTGICTGSYGQIWGQIRTGSATFGSATIKSAGYAIIGGASYQVETSLIGPPIYLNVGDTIHLGGAFDGSSGNRTIYGDNQQLFLTGFSFQRTD